jgi:hypothetical protein
MLSAGQQGSHASLFLTWVRVGSSHISGSSIASTLGAAAAMVRASWVEEATMLGQQCQQLIARVRRGNRALPAGSVQAVGELGWSRCAANGKEADQPW